MMGEVQADDLEAVIEVSSRDRMMCPNASE